MTTTEKTTKLLYKVPSMAEIEAIPWNGFNVVSTFSGCGGSCLGYRMAGYRVLWANEFIPVAQQSYRANHPNSILDPRDIHIVQAQEILAAAGLKQGELDLFDGSPPCQAFSTAGKREKNWGKNKIYENGIGQKNETLFTEYIRLLRGLMPKIFIAENVSGLVKGTAKGYFKEILAELKASGYVVEAKLLDAQWLGVPQMRQRIIFQGVRDDLNLKPVFPKPLHYRYSVRDALPGIVNLIHDTSGLFSQGDVTDRPCPAITNGINGLNSNHFKVEGANGFNGHAYQSADVPCATIQASRPLNDIERPAGHRLPPSRLKAGAYGVSDVHPEKPCPTVTISSPGNDLAVAQDGGKRKFTIAELRRICAFPDDFILIGSYAQQWERLGNSVPPVMMKALAETVRDGVLSRC